MADVKVKSDLAIFLFNSFVFFSFSITVAKKNFVSNKDAEAVDDISVASKMYVSTNMSNENEFFKLRQKSATKFTKRAFTYWKKSEKVTNFISRTEYVSESTVNVSQPQNEKKINSKFHGNMSINVTAVQSDLNKKTSQPFWGCTKYNVSSQMVIVVKDKISLIWWLEEMNRSMSCAIVLFYAKWCYFSAQFAPVFNAVGRAFYGIPILAFDAYNHNSFNTRYGIVGVPTIILFQEGRPVARFNRSKTFQDLVDFIHENTGMDYNRSVKVDDIDYNEGPLSSSLTDETNIYLLVSLCFLLFMGLLLLWHLQYLQYMFEYLKSFSPTPSIMLQTERVKHD